MLVFDKQFCYSSWTVLLSILSNCFCSLTICIPGVKPAFIACLLFSLCSPLSSRSQFTVKHSPYAHYTISIGLVLAHRSGLIHHPEWWSGKTIVENVKTKGWACVLNNASTLFKYRLDAVLFKLTSRPSAVRS